MSETRERAHELIDQLPPAQLAAVARLIEAMLDPGEIGEEDKRAINEAKQRLQENGTKGGG